MKKKKQTTSLNKKLISLSDNNEHLSMLVDIMDKSLSFAVGIIHALKIENETLEREISDLKAKVKKK